MFLKTLPNGLKIAFLQNPTVHSVAINLFIGCGSSNETEETKGAAHFLEHMLFKGTERFGNRELSEKMDKLGGQFNAYTTKEYTCIFCNVTTYDFCEALEIVLEMATAPKIETCELETERGVILEEINMYEDSPEDCAADAISEVIFKNCGLKHKILGTPQTVAGFSAESLKNHHKKFYVPERMVLSVCGNFDEDTADKLINKYLLPMQNTNFPLCKEKAEISSGIVLREKDFEQSQIVIAAPSCEMGNPKRFATSVYSAIVGGNASSHLNMHIREKLGLAYSIYSYPISYTPLGTFLITAGTSHKNHIKVIEEILKVTDNLCNSITEQELARVKSQYRATSVLGNESISAVSATMGREILFKGKYTPIDEVIEKINALTLEDIISVHKDIWQKERLALCVVGKPKDIETYKKLGFN